MNNLSRFFLLMLLTACSKDPLPEVKSSNYAASSFATSLPRVQGKKVKELLVVVFKKDFSPEVWKRIFDQTRKLSENKKKLRAIEGALDDAANETRLNLLGENAELLLELADQSAFLMSWSSQDENCSLSNEERPFLSCSPLSLDNVMNGGMPKAMRSVQWVEPNPIFSNSKIPYLSVMLEQTNPRFEIELRLSEEALEDQNILFKGEALPTAESAFRSEDGAFQTGVYPYGYAEMLLGE